MFTIDFYVLTLSVFFRGFCGHYPGAHGAPYVDSVAIKQSVSLFTCRCQRRSTLGVAVSASGVSK